MNPTRTAAQIAAAIDHTLLAAHATTAEIDKLCDEAREFAFCAVCINPVHVERARRRLEGSKVGIATVVGFPLGANRPDVKADETRRAVDDGADEIDMVVALGHLVGSDAAYVRRDIEAVSRATHEDGRGRILKVILETSALTPEQIIVGCRCAAEGEADFVKTSTGFHPSGGATLEAVRLLHRHASPLKVKASGGIRDLASLQAMLDAGASRIGTSSGVKIVREAAGNGPRNA
ncbi:MAG: deoxyribose-phosphate aldolase [Phycisphaerales bacterium]|nr:deoxyribose-phosphate aldolase [Phycisphaerales bacterium]